jgi:beta-N-acetylhexosaminidase
VFAALALAISLAVAPKPHIVWKPIPYGPRRKAEMAAYAKKHYGIHSWRLHPKVIVEHYTASNSFSAAWNTFAADTPDPELRELPGTCAHFIVDRDGTIYQLVRLNVMCRHTVGLNYVAIGIEDVGTSDAEILHDRAQLRSALALSAWLVGRFQIRIRNVIGHNESLSSPYHKELYKPWAHQTHSDWKHHDMDVFRSKLRALLRADRRR